MRGVLAGTPKAIAEGVARAGGRALLVGGVVRDLLMGRGAKDLDFEVYDLDLHQLEGVLGAFGEVMTVGRSFGVLRVKGIDADFSLPRRDSKVAAGHKGFSIACDPGLDFSEASRRRDVTINSMGLDPLTGEILDPHGGRADLQHRVLRATDARHFSEDPLRGLRVAQFAARFDMTPDADLEALCAALDLSELSAERVWAELETLVVQGGRPSLGLALLQRTGMVRFFPELQALIGVPQDPTWHPEGDVWTHTLMVVDAAAQLRDGGNDDRALMFAALCHDLGKPMTTVLERGRIRSPQHDVRGAAETERFLLRLRAPKAFVDTVASLVRHHLAPALYVKERATAKGYRRLARRLAEGGATMQLLLRVATADHFGRTTPDACARDFPAGKVFLDNARQLLIEREAPLDVVQGRHLVARGLRPGPHFAAILSACREVQDETGLKDADAIIARAFPDVSVRRRTPG